MTWMIDKNTHVNKRSKDLKCLEKGKEVDTGSYIITQMLLEGELKYLHFNNYKTNKNSAIVPIEEIKKVMNE